MARYLERLVRLHHRCRALADGGDTQMAAMLAELGLATVREADMKWKPWGREVKT